MNRIFKRKDDVVTRNIAGETLLVPIKGELAGMEKLFAVEDVAAFIWEQFDGSNSLKTIHKKIMRHYDSTEEQARQDLLAFVDILRNAGLLVQVN